MKSEDVRARTLWAGFQTLVRCEERYRSGETIIHDNDRLTVHRYERHSAFGCRDARRIHRDLFETDVDRVDVFANGISRTIGTATQRIQLLPEAGQVVFEEIDAVEHHHSHTIITLDAEGAENTRPAPAHRRQSGAAVGTTAE